MSSSCFTLPHLKVLVNAWWQSTDHATSLGVLGGFGLYATERLPKRRSPGPCSLASTDNQTVLAEAGIYYCKKLRLFCRPWFPAEAKVKFYTPCHARVRHSPSEVCNSEPHTTQDMLMKRVPDITLFGFKAMLVNLGCWVSLQTHRAALRGL